MDRLTVFGAARRLAATSAILAALLSASSATWANDMLRGVNNLSLVIESLDSDAMECGVTKTDIEMGVRFILQQSKIRLSKEARGGMIYVGTIVGKTGGGSTLFCIATFSMEVAVMGTVRTVEYGVLKEDLVTLWSQRTLLSLPRQAPGKKTSEAIEGLAKRLVVDWSKVNQ